MKNLYELCEYNRNELAKGRSIANGEKVFYRPCKEVENELNSYPLNYIFHISDLEAYFKVHVYAYNSGKNTAKSYNVLQEARNKNITFFTDKAALTPEQFSENLKNRANIHVPARPTSKPQNLAFELLSKTFPEELQVINAACNLMKSELAALTSIRSHIRDLYIKYARISTSPTDKGRLVLDVFHPFYRVKNLVEGKPANTWAAEL